MAISIVYRSDLHVIRLVANTDGYPKQFPLLKTLHHMVYGTFNGKGFLVLLLFLAVSPWSNGPCLGYIGIVLGWGEICKTMQWQMQFGNGVSIHSIFLFAIIYLCI